MSAYFEELGWTLTRHGTGSERRWVLQSPWTGLMRKSRSLKDIFRWWRLRVECAYAWDFTAKRALDIYRSTDASTRAEILDWAVNGVIDDEDLRYELCKPLYDDLPVPKWRPHAQRLHHLICPTDDVFFEQVVRAMFLEHQARELAAQTCSVVEPAVMKLRRI